MTIEEIISKIPKDKFNNNIYIGDHYSVAQLLEDLEKLKET